MAVFTCFNHIINANYIPNKNWKNKLIWILILSSSVDLFMGVGVNESFIHGGHFIFVIPLFIAWLFKSIKDEYQTYFGYLILILTLTMLTNNVYRMIDFIKFARQIFSHDF